MLVLFKANTLVELEQREAELEDLSEDDLLDTKEGVQAKLRLPLEHQLQRRPAALPPRKRRVTLQVDRTVAVMATHCKFLSQLRHSPPKPPAFASHPRCPCDTRAGSPRKSHRSCRGTGAVLNANSHRILNQEQDWLNLDQLVELWTQIKRCTPMTFCQARQ